MKTITMNGKSYKTNLIPFEEFSKISSLNTESIEVCRAIIFKFIEIEYSDVLNLDLFSAKSIVKTLFSLSSFSKENLISGISSLLEMDGLQLYMCKILILCGYKVSDFSNMSFEELSKIFFREMLFRDKFVDVSSEFVDLVNDSVKFDVKEKLDEVLNKFGMADKLTEDEMSAMDAIMVAERILSNKDK